MRSTFKILFYINRGKVKKDGTTAIFCRITVDGEQTVITTGIFCNPNDWKSKKGEVKDEKANHQLKAFRQRIEQAYENTLKNMVLSVWTYLKMRFSKYILSPLCYYWRARRNVNG